MPTDPIIRVASSAADMEIARILLREYATYLNESLGEEHICLEAYDSELASLPGPYSEPGGAILLAFIDEQPAGCVALKPLRPNRATVPEEHACEIKRLWVRPEFRSQKVGLQLTQALIDQARQRDYTAMYLDTIPEAMQSANAIYRRLGFQPVGRYNINPILGMNPAVAVEFFRLTID